MYTFDIVLDGNRLGNDAIRNLSKKNINNLKEISFSRK